MVSENTFMARSGWLARNNFSHARFSSYILRITTNLCLSKLRRKKVLQLDPDPGGRGAEPSPPSSRSLPRGLAYALS